MDVQQTEDFFMGSLFTGGRNSYLIRPLLLKRSGGIEKLEEGEKTKVRLCNYKALQLTISASQIKR